MVVMCDLIIKNIFSCHFAITSQLMSAWTTFRVHPTRKSMTLCTMRKYFYCEFALACCTVHRNIFRTLLKQEATININGIPMASYLEDVIKSTMNENAQKVMKYTPIFLMSVFNLFFISTSLGKKSN